MLHSGRKKIKESADNPKVDNKRLLSYGTSTDVLTFGRTKRTDNGKQSILK